MRLYIVCIRADLRVNAFHFPEPLDPSLVLGVSQLLAPTVGSDDGRRLPAAPALAARAHVQQAALKLDADFSGDWLIPQQLSASFHGARGAKPRFEWPSLLHSNREGYWVGSRGRPASRDETCRAQGLDPRIVRWVPGVPHMPFALLGNTMSCCVLQRLFVAILRQVWGLNVPDPWETGSAQRKLLDSTAVDIEASSRAEGRNALLAAFARGAVSPVAPVLSRVRKI